MEVDGAVQIDPGEYVALYEGHGRVARLHLLAKQPELRRAALRSLAQELRANSILPEAYQAACKQAQEAGAADVQIDAAWVQQVRLLQRADHLDKPPRAA